MDIFLCNSSVSFHKFNIIIMAITIDSAWFYWGRKLKIQLLKTTFNAVQLFPFSSKLIWLECIVRFLIDQPGNTIWICRHTGMILSRW